MQVRFLLVLVALVTFASVVRTVQAESAVESKRPPGAEFMFYDADLGKLVLVTSSSESERMTLWTREGSGWRQLTSTGPRARQIAAYAYDPQHRKLVLHGGMGMEDREDRRADTWEWDGNQWQEAPAPAVGARDHHAMAYDSSRGRTVLFGGVKAGETLETDTWEWDGSEWKKVATEGPGGRAHTTLTYHDRLGKSILFGGLAETYQVPPQTWAFDGNEWKMIAETGPPPRTHHRACYDPERGVVVLFGGLLRGNPRQALGDTWEFDGEQWKQVEAAGPPARSGHVMAFHPERKRVVMFGGGSFDGTTSTNHADLWEFDGSKWAQVENASAPDT